MKTKLRVILFVKLLTMLIIMLLITACSPIKYEVEVDSVDIVNLTFEYKPWKLGEDSKEIIYIETEELTYVIDYEEVEFVKSDKSTFTEKHRKASFTEKDRKVLGPSKYATIELGPELIKSASSEYAKTMKKTLNIK